MAQSSRQLFIQKSEILSLSKFLQQNPIVHPGRAGDEWTTQAAKAAIRSGRMVLAYDFVALDFKSP
ncbi:hypothetical protein BIT28_01770 [Photobacterium proteolyticum]|uniref:Uncharacterized protein n=1 Tax=Photobacterium proteolyticum TaxID=1903952 RepID=A0A1Q9GV98_9GAMM|nr:hypothetical protein BIT28_01770 [Photobacterium proteolyticum]